MYVGISKTKRIIFISLFLLEGIGFTKPSKNTAQKTDALKGDENLWCFLKP